MERADENILMISYQQHQDDIKALKDELQHYRFKMLDLQDRLNAYECDLNVSEKEDNISKAVGIIRRPDPEQVSPFKDLNSKVDETTPSSLLESPSYI